MKSFLSFSSLLSLLLSITIAAHGQSCTTAICNAASPNEADVLAALPSSNNTNATVVVNIPSNTGAWTSQLTYTIPASVTNLTIQGNTTVSCTGTAGTSSYSCTPADQTIIQDNDTNSNFGLWQINAGGGGVSSNLRITGITIQGGTGITKGQGLILVFGPTHNLRIDHMHFNAATYTGGSASFWMHEIGEVEGVADHNVFDNTPTGIVQANIASNNIGDSLGNGDGTWANPTPFGTSGNFFLESNVINGGTFTDCDTAGSVVVRYNTANGTTSVSAAMHSHGTYSNSGRARSCRAYEFYHNYVTGPSPSTNALVGTEGGTSLVWGNTLVSGYQNLANVDNARNRVEEINTPNGWGYCGTSVDGNGVGSPWDGNQNISTGYPCLDGLGRGQGQALNGLSFPSVIDSLLGLITWPRQYLEPIYYFDNTLPSGINELILGDPSSQLNRDVYIDNASFNGTSGTGTGQLSARPSTCTPGPGGTYGTSPTGSYGVAYFATDANSGSGELYVCTAANTWTGIYQPYTYPHPLVSGNSTGSSSNTPPAPTGLVSTVE